MKAGGKVWRFEALLREDGWLSPAYVTLDAAGRTQAIGERRPKGAGEMERVPGYAVPGIPNAHSHAFQFAMAGLAERLAVADDDFWSWREAMYGLALTISPDELEAVAAMLYAEMLRQGYTAVAEFHYLHRDPDGRPYADPAELGARLAAAAEQTGIRLTLVPVYYRTGDFGEPASPRQRRFLFEDLDDYWRLWKASQAAVAKVGGQMGAGVHSLRAASSEDALALLRDAPPETPRHIHIAEQRREVERCLAYLGQRPVAWLLDHSQPDARFCLVHATHLTEQETNRLAASGATVCLCPSTEGNLGDGFFPLRDYQSKDGRWAIGSDSHVGLNPMEELRWLDYGQRLRLEKRNALCRRVGDDSGQQAYRRALLGGRAAVGQSAAAFFPLDEPFDALVLDPRQPAFAGRPLDRVLSGLVYRGDSACLLGTVIDGAWAVKDGRHVRAEPIFRAYRRAIDALSARV